MTFAQKTVIKIARGKVPPVPGLYGGVIGMGPGPGLWHHQLRTMPAKFSRARSGQMMTKFTSAVPYETALRLFCPNKERITDPREPWRNYRNELFQLKSPEMESSIPIFGCPSRGWFAKLNWRKAQILKHWPHIDPLRSDSLWSAPFSLKMGDDIITDEIWRPGPKCCPFKSNTPPESSKYTFTVMMTLFMTRAMKSKSPAWRTHCSRQRNLRQGSVGNTLHLHPNNLGKCRIALS